MVVKGVDSTFGRPREDGMPGHQYIEKPIRKHTRQMVFTIIDRTFQTVRILAVNMRSLNLLSSAMSKKRISWQHVKRVTEVHLESWSFCQFAKTGRGTQNLHRARDLSTGRSFEERNLLCALRGEKSDPTFAASRTSRGLTALGPSTRQRKVCGSWTAQFRTAGSYTTAPCS